MEYDLKNRTLLFSKSIIGFLKRLKINDLNRNIFNQVIRSATSVGANYAEANGASSKRDFKNKIYICKKEIQETEYWIELLSEVVNEEEKNKLRKIWKEAHELTLIFNKIASSLKK